MSRKIDAVAMVEAVTLGLDRQRMGLAMRQEITRRINLYLAGGDDPDQPAVQGGRADERIELTIADAVAIATGGRARGFPKLVTVMSDTSWNYSGARENGWEETVEEVGADVIASRVARMLNGDHPVPMYEAGFGMGRSKPNTLTVRLVRR